MSVTLDRKLRGELLKFSGLHNRRSDIKIQGISKGIDPSEEYDVYYFLMGESYSPNESFEDEITQLGSSLMDSYGSNENYFELCTFPIDPRSVLNEEFLGEIICEYD